MEKKAQTFTEALDMISKHMPGKHDQKDHGRKGAAKAPGAITVEGLKEHAAKVQSEMDTQNKAEKENGTQERVRKELSAALKDNKDFDEVIKTIRKVEMRRAERQNGGKLTEEDMDRLREGAVQDLMIKWNVTSGDSDPLAVAMQQAAMKEFKIQNTGLFNSSPNTIKEAENKFGGIQPGLQGFMRAQYDNTQKYLKEKGLEEITLYRGTKWTADEAPKGLNFNATPGKQTVQLQPLSSFSASVDVALRFTGIKQMNLITGTRVKADQVISIGMTGMGTKREAEAVILGGTKDVWTFGWDTKAHTKPTSQETYEHIAAASSLK